MFDYEENTWASGYIDPHQSIGYDARQLEWVMKEIPDHSVRVLEIGCGQGKFIRSLVRQNPTDVLGWGFDFSHSALKESAAYPEHVSYQQGDATQLPFSDESFDMIFAFDVLEHVEDYQVALQEIRRTLKAGGKFIIGVPCEGEFFTLHHLLLHNTDIRLRLHGHIHRFTHEGFQSTLIEAGFDIIKCYYALHWLGQIADFLSDRLLGNGAYNRETLYGSIKWKVFSDPLLIVRAIFMRFGYYESRLLRQFRLTALSGIITSMVKKNKVQIQE